MKEFNIYIKFYSCQQIIQDYFLKYGDVSFYSKFCVFIRLIKLAIPKWFTRLSYSSSVIFIILQLLLLLLLVRLCKKLAGVLLVYELGEILWMWWNKVEPFVDYLLVYDPVLG